MRTRHAFAVLAVLVVTVSARAENRIAAQMAAAQHDYDMDAAKQALEDARGAATVNPTRDATLLVAQAALLVAELERFDWENIPESDIADRRPLGNDIDEAANAGLHALASLEPDSETYRLKADLLAVMIRSDYRAKKYRKDMEAAAAKAVELNPANAKAYVSRAKPYVFAKSNEGGDPVKAIALLSKALELDPNLETARCLRGLAYKKAGEFDNARADWEQALKDNPNCRPAKEQLTDLASS